MKTIKASIGAMMMTALLLSPAPVRAEEAAEARPAVEIADAREAQGDSYTVAVLPFNVAKGDYDDMGQDVQVLMNAYMSVSPSLMLVERAEVDKALGEVELGKSGTVDPETAAKVGHLVGAQVLVTGRIFPVQKDLMFVAKIIGVETGRTFGETAEMPLRGNFKDATRELSDKIAAVIAAHGPKMVAKEKKEDILAKLRPLVEGRKDLPTVSVTIEAMNMNRTDTDTSAQTEIAWVLEKLGFTLIDQMASNKKADIEVTGTALSEFAMRKGNLVSAKARVEIKALKRKDGKVILVDREPTVAVDLSPEAAGKQAQAKAAALLAERLVKAITEMK